MNLRLGTILIALLIVALLGPPPTFGQESIQDSLIRESENCNLTGGCNRNPSPGATPSGPTVDPCYIAQNALRPCLHAALAWSASTNRVGMSYREASEEQAKRDAVTNCVHNGGGSDCKAVGWVTSGCGALAISPAKIYGWSGSTKTRAAAWNEALAQCGKNGVRGCSVALATCTDDDPQLVNLRYLPYLPLPVGSENARVDPQLVGTWAFTVNPGRWIWQIGPRGTYSFHSETADLTPTHAGTFTATNGQWTLRATSGYVDIDGGSYRILGPDAVSMTGRYGTGTWRRVSQLSP